MPKVSETLAILMSSIVIILALAMLLLFYGHPERSTTSMGDEQRWSATDSTDLTPSSGSLPSSQASLSLGKESRDLPPLRQTLPSD